MSSKAWRPASRPAGLDIGDAVARVAEQRLAPGGQVDELGAAVRGIGPAGQIAMCLKVIDEFRSGRQAELCARRQLGQADSAHADVAEDLVVGLPDVGIAPLRGGRREVVAEHPQQPVPVAGRWPVGRWADRLTRPWAPTILRKPKFRLPKQMGEVRDGIEFVTTELVGFTFDARAPAHQSCCGTACSSIRGRGDHWSTSCPRPDRVRDRRPLARSERPGPSGLHLRRMRRRRCDGPGPLGAHRARRLGRQCMGRPRRYPAGLRQPPRVRHADDHRHTGPQPSPARRRWTKVLAAGQLYRVAGPSGFIL